MRGFGQSTPMPRDYAWTLDGLIDDFCRLMDHLGIARFHLVGAKIGGTIARAFAARRPDRVMTLTVVGTPPPFRVRSPRQRVPDLIRDFETHGVEYWARQNMGTRLGSGFPPEGVAWWTSYMGRTAASTQIGFMGPIAAADIRADLPQIACPTLVIVTEQSALGSVDETRAWQQQIADSELLVLPGNSYHVAATHADLECRSDAGVSGPARPRRVTRLAARAANRRRRPMPAPYEKHRAQIKAILLAWGMPEDNAEATADILSWADLHGVDSHGMSMIPATTACAATAARRWTRGRASSRKRRSPHWWMATAGWATCRRGSPCRWRSTRRSSRAWRSPRYATRRISAPPAITR